MPINGLWAILVIAVDVFVILKVTSASITTAEKALWIVIVLVLPILGAVAWFLIGPGDKSFKV